MEQRINIGRNKRNNVFIDYGKVSGNHCVIKKNGSEYIIEDLNSSNGVFLEGKRIKQAYVKADSVLKLSDFEVNVTLLLSLFDMPKIPIGMSYEQLLKREGDLRKKQEEEKKKESIKEEFLKLEEVYNQYIKDKKKIRRGDSIKKTGFRALLLLIPFVGNALGAFFSGATNKTQDKLIDREEIYKTEYICPICSKYMHESFINIKKSGKCPRCNKQLM